jgi:hypothetical protein
MDKLAAVVGAALEPPSPAARRVGWGFISPYTLAYMSTNLLFLAPLLVTLALKVDSLVGNQRAPASLALVAAVGALLAMVANPFFGRMSDRTASPLGMRRPLDGQRPGGRFRRHPHGRAGPQHPGGPARMVHHPAVLQRAARRDSGGHARPDPVRPARPGLRCAGCLPAHRVGVRRVRGQAVRRQPAHHVPGPVRDRRIFRPPFRRSRRPSWRSAAAAAVTACCTWSPDSAPSSGRSPSCP